MKYLKTLLFIILISTISNGQNTILWKIDHLNTEHSSYLLGTFHQFGNSFVDSLPLIESSLLSCDLAIFESIDSRDSLIDIMNQRECSQYIKGLLNSKDYQQLKEISSEWKVELCKLSPQEVYMKLQQQITITKCLTALPEDEWNHFDRYINHIALTNDKEVMGLESSVFQLAEINKLLDNGNRKADKKDISDALKVLNGKKTPKNLCLKSNKYRNFELSENNFGEICIPSGSLFQRNSSWMKILPEQLMNQSCFITVGLMHIMKDCGLIHQLEEKGYIITPIKLR